MKKAITLVELIIAVVLMGIVVLGAISFDLASKNFFKSSERKVEVLNDLTFILEHMHKNILSGEGYVDDKALDWDGSVLTVNQSTGATVTYTFNTASHTVVFNDTVGSQTLTDRLSSLGTFEVDDFGGLSIESMYLMFDADGDFDVRTNPRVGVKQQYFFPAAQSSS